MCLVMVMTLDQLQLSLPRFFHGRGEKHQPESRWRGPSHPVFTGDFFLLLYLFSLSHTHFWLAHYQFTLGDKARGLPKCSPRKVEYLQSVFLEQSLKCPTQAALSYY